MDWYRTIYRPLITIIKRGRLVDSFPERTVADLYAYITLHHWKQGRKRRYGLVSISSLSKIWRDFERKWLN